MGRQWHQLNHMQAICTLLQKITTPALHQSDFYRPDDLPDTQPTASKHWRHFLLLLVLFIIRPTTIKNKWLFTIVRTFSKSVDSRSLSGVCYKAMPSKRHQILQHVVSMNKCNAVCQVALYNTHVCTWNTTIIFFQRISLITSLLLFDYFFTS